jgi:hypothetical protein
MELQKDWYAGVAKEIGSIKESLGERDHKKYKLILLLKLAKRVANLAADCTECQYMQGRVTRLTEDLKYPYQMTPRKYGDYLTTIKDITRHLKQKHRLVEERQYVKRFVYFSTTVGVSLIVLGYVLLSFGITLLALSITLPALVARVIFGYAFGRFLDRRAKKKGRLI